MENIKALLKNFMGFISRMTPSQVMMLFGILAGTIVGIVIMVGWLNNVNYSRLYSNLEESEAGEVTTYLNENKIPFQLKDNGTTIEVPSDDVYRVRISLAAEGLPEWETLGWILLAMFGARNAAMGFNRLADHEHDARNPRTAAREPAFADLMRQFRERSVEKTYLALVWGEPRFDTGWIEAPIARSLTVPPAPSMSAAISPCGNRSVPLNSMCSKTCAIPATAGSSSALPNRTQVCKATTGALWSSSKTTCRPFDSVWS